MSEADENDVLVEFAPSGQRGHFPQGTSILTAAYRLGVDIGSECGGRGTCGQCEVRVSRGDKCARRLGCLEQVYSDVVIEVPTRAGTVQQVIRKPVEQHDIDIDPVTSQGGFGVAIDVGSTTLAASLCDLVTGEVVASAGELNPQVRFGEDLMSRISYAMSTPEGEKELTDCVRSAINALIDDLAARAHIDRTGILAITLVGNSIMHHVVLGISPVQLGLAPFELVREGAVELPASDIDIPIHPDGRVYALPCIAGHVGADTAALLLAEAPDESDDVSLFIDVGTNAELVLGNRARLVAASSPTGPAFEGGEISSGQRAAPGAIERVRIDPQTLETRIKVIGCDLWSDDPGFATQTSTTGVTGICGSGIIEGIVEMRRAGIIDRDGHMRSPDDVFVVHHGKREIGITQADVRAIQLAKAALFASARLLVEQLGVDSVDRIRLAGAFGNHIDPAYALALGMIPACKAESVTSAGNAAGTGARIALLDKKSRPRIEALVNRVEKIETATAARFLDCFVDAMALPGPA